MGRRELINEVNNNNIRRIEEYLETYSSNILKTTDKELKEKTWCIKLLAELRFKECLMYHCKVKETSSIKEKIKEISFEIRTYFKDENNYNIGIELLLSYSNDLLQLYSAKKRLKRINDQKFKKLQDKFSDIFDTNTDYRIIMSDLSFSLYPLIAYNSLQDISFKDNKNILLTAVQTSSLDIIKYFLDKGADINSKDDKNNTVLHYAVKLNTLHVIKYLIKLVENINETNKNGESILHFAVLYNSIDVIKFLIKKGANFNVITNTGDTILHYAAQYNTLDTLQYLVNLGLDITAKNRSGTNILDYAIKYQNSSDIIEYLKRQKGTHEVKNNNDEAMPLISDQNSSNIIAYLKGQKDKHVNNEGVPFISDISFLIFVFIYFLILVFFLLIWSYVFAIQNRKKVKDLM